MDSGVITKSNTDSEILSFDVLDELLERVANAEQSAFTLAFCTNNWDNCGMPPTRAEIGPKLLQQPPLVAPAAWLFAAMQWSRGNN
jgi:hypothetical protein